jgi:hypothetical protein
MASGNSRGRWAIGDVEEGDGVDVDGRDASGDAVCLR